MKVSVQEGLESEFQRIRQHFNALSAERVKAIATERESFFDERRLLIAKILETQEQLAKKVSAHSSLERELASCRTLIKRLYNDHPQVSEGLGLEVTPVHEAEEKHNTLQWCLKDIYIADRYFAELKFKTVIHESMAGIVFSRFAELGRRPTFKRWPASHINDDEVLLIPVFGSVIAGSNATLTDLGSADWRLLNELVPILLRIMKRATVKIVSADVANAYVIGLTNLAQSLTNWPSVMRFDRVSLHAVKKRGGYTGIEIYLENVVQGYDSWSELIYCIASVDGPNGEFGHHPRIEISKRYSSFFEKWTPEATVDCEEFFELRFSLPDDMDIPVWRALSDLDKVRIASLVSCMPSQFAELRLSQDFQDVNKWIAVCHRVRKILSKNALALQPQ